MRVLIVEDNPSDAEMVLRELRRAGFEPDWHRVDTAHEYLERLHPDLDLILSDYEMPTFSGPHALELLQQRALNIPFIIISGTIGEDLAVEAMKCGAADYLLKDRLGRLGSAVALATEKNRLRRERQETQEELRSAHEEIRRLLEHSPAVIYSLKIEGERVVPTRLSENVLRLTGYSTEEACSSEWWLAHLHPDDKERTLAIFGEVLEKGELSNEYRLLHRDGHYIWLQDDRRLVRDAQGAPVEIAGAWTDITERKYVEHVLQTSQAERLREAETQTAILNAVPAHIALVDPTGVIVSVNESWRRFADCNNLADPDFCLGRNYIEVCERAFGENADGAHRVAQALRDVLQGRLSKFAMEYPCPSSEEARWFRLTISPLADGRQLGAVVMHMDITERKLAEDAVREGGERFRQLAENIQEVFWISNIPKDTILYISPAYASIWGRTCESLYASPKSWMEAIHPDDCDRVTQAALTTQRDGTFDEEYRILRPDGSMRWIRDRAFPVRDDLTGEVYRVAGVAEDITERKHGGQRLLEQAALLDKARDAILVSDMEYRITYWNKSAERLYGWTVDEVIGRKVCEVLYANTDCLTKPLATLLEEGEWNGEFTHLTKAGGKLLIEVRWTLVRDSDGNPTSVLSINTDITEKRKLEQQFLRAQRMENIGTLAGGIAHDLNNVLAPIMMSIDLMRLTNRDEKTMGVLSTIETSARRGADMVHQILSFARGVEGERVSLDPCEIIKDIQYLVQDTFPKNIDFKIQLDAELPCIVGDHTQVHQILLNLCVNARDAMPEGGLLSLTASTLVVDENYASMNGEAKPGPYLMLKVSDTGTGIPRSVVDKIFDPFFTTKAVGKGTGLGLSTVLGIVKGHHGFLSVQSEPRRGTTFTVCLPASLTASGTAIANAEEMHPRGNGEMVLIVDDEAAVRTITQQTLEAFGYQVLVAGDGAEAVAMYAHNEDNIAAVLVDMMMPVMDGAATIQVLMRLNGEVKIIAASGLNAEGAAAKAAAMGVKHFLVKPYTAQTLLMILHQVLVAR